MQAKPPNRFTEKVILRSHYNSEGKWKTEFITLLLSAGIKKCCFNSLVLSDVAFGAWMLWIALVLTFALWDQTKSFKRQKVRLSRRPFSQVTSVQLNLPEWLWLRNINIGQVFEQLPNSLVLQNKSWSGQNTIFLTAVRSYRKRMCIGSRLTTHTVFKCFPLEYYSRPPNFTDMKNFENV